MLSEKVKLSSIKVNKKNPRKIDKMQFDSLVKSILVFPKMLNDLRPIVVDENMTILGGNMRYRALIAISTMTTDDCRNRMSLAKNFNKKTSAEKAEIEKYWAEWRKAPIVDVVKADNLDEEAKKEFIIKDNVSFGEWDNEILKAEFDLGELQDFGLDLPEFADEKVEEAAEEDDFSEEEAAKADTRCKDGDIWKLGRHRLICGDSTNIEVLNKLCNGLPIDLFVTDPPYNVNYEGETEQKMKIKNDNMEDRQFINFLTAAFSSACQVMRAGAAFYIWHADSEGYNFRKGLINAGLQIKQTLIWVKNRLVFGRQDYQWQHEPCLYGWKEGAAHYFISDRTNTTVIEDNADFKKMKREELLKIVLEMNSPTVPTTVIHEDKPQRNADHPTMKPVKLIARLIKNSSRQNDNVLDTFGGSGTTVIACEQLNRNCFMAELDEHYCDVIIARWEKLTGQKAEKLED